MIEWQEVLLEEVADELTVGYVGSMASEYVPSGIPFLRSLNIEPLRVNKNDLIFITPEFHKRISKSRLSPGDVVIVRTGKPGTCTIIPEWLSEANCSDLVIVRCGKRINNRFLAYYVNTAASNHIAAHLVGAVQQHFNVGAARTLKINLPPINEQLAIVDVLSALDNKIELNQRMNGMLEGVAQAIFKSWFVDFDPVKAKVEGRMPEGMDDATATLFPSRFIDSPLGLIPEGWKSSSIGECFKVIMGQSPPGETYNEIKEGIAFYQGRTDFGWRFPMERIYCNAPTRFAERNDTLVSVRAPVGDVNVALDRCCIGRGVAALRHNSDASSFTYYTAQQLQAHFKNFDSEGTVFGSINKADFAKLPHIEPKDKVIQLYETIAGSLDKRIKTNEDQIRTLTEVRDNLLPRLISGKLRVGEISETVEALAL